MVCLADWRFQLMSDEVDVENPLGGGGSILVHRRWVFEFEMTSEDSRPVNSYCEMTVALHSLRRDTWSSGSMTYRFSLWNEDPRWTGTSVEGSSSGPLDIPMDCICHLRSV